MSSIPLPSHRPKGMKVDAALAHLRQHHGMTVTRRTLYNWIKAGVRGVRLQHSLVPSTCPTAKDREVVVISPAQIEAFLASVGVKGVTMQ